jgi:hypothetical protein
MKSFIPYRVMVLYCLFSGCFSYVKAQTPLYISKQTGEISTYSGNQSKTTDKYEHGTVTLSKEGPITYDVNPALSIGINETKTWNGTVKPDPASAPEAGTSVTAKLKGDYDVTYSRPQGGGGPSGTVLSTYNCNEGVDDGCAYHGPGGGMHEIVQVTGQQSLDFIVYSIKVTLPDTIFLSNLGEGNSASGSGEPVSFPDRPDAFLWTSLSPLVTIDNPNSKNPTITLSDKSVTNAKVRVKFTVEGVSYTTEAVVKYSECNCKPITNGMALGPLQVTFTAAPSSTAPDGQGYCVYTSSNASFTLQMNNTIENKSANITNATVSFKKNCKTGDLKDISIIWTGDLDIGKIKYDGASLKEVNLTVNTSGQLSGSVKLQAKLTEDVDLTGKNIMILKKGITGTFAFNFTLGTNLSGSFDFMGITDINAEIKKAGTVIASFKNGSLNSAGDLTATFTAEGGASYKTNLFKITVNTLSLDFKLGMSSGFSLTGGSGGVTVSDMAGVKGTVDLALTFTPTNVTASVTVKDMTAFSMELKQAHLQADFNYDFDMTQLKGDLQAKHTQFDVAIAVSQFQITNGKLDIFECSGSVKYSGFSFNLTKGSYTAADSKLTISAEAVLNITTANMSLAVDKFTIDGDGNITVGEIKGNLDKDPLKASFSAKFEASRFKGTFDATFTSIGLKGSVDIGAQPDFNFAYFEIIAKTNVVLGQTGLKLTQIGGQAGYNYKLPDAPTKGNYVIGLTIGVADVAGLCEVAGNPVIQLGTSSVTMSLNGTVKVLKDNTFFTGKLESNYVLPDNTVSGSVSTEIKVPSSGFIFTSNNLKVDFNVGSNKWHAGGSNMGGKMFNTVDFSDGNITLDGSISSPLALTGKLGGKATANFSQTVGVGALGINFSGNITVNMNSNISADLDQNGLAGSFGVHVDGSGTLNYSTWITDGSVSVSGNSDANIGYQNGNLKLYGNMTVNLPFTICVPWTSYCLSSLSVGLDVSI